MIKEVEVKNKAGLVLRGLFDCPDDFQGEIVAMFHGFTGNRTEHAMHFRSFSRVLSEAGIASVRFDYSGNGESDGEFADMTFTSLIEETNLIIDFAKSLPGVKNVDVLGYSMGGAIGAHVASRRHDVNRLLLWNPAGNINETVIKRYEAAQATPATTDAMGTFTLSAAMYESAKTFNPYDGLFAYTNPVCIISALKDLAVPHEYAARYSLSFPDSYLHLVQTAGHGFDLPAEKEELYRKSLEFFKNNYKIA